MVTTIPFSGFYESFHSSELDRELESIVSDSNGCSPISERLSNEVWDCLNWADAMQDYAKEYAGYFAHWFAGEFDVQLTWESMTSPREYNFSTDRIFCTISEQDARKLLQAVSPEILANVAKEMFTSRSGFISYYSPDVEEWGDLATWDHNQVSALVKAAVMQADESDVEYSLIEHMSGNGVASNAIYSALNDKGKRICRIADYLRRRSERKVA